MSQRAILFSSRGSKDLAQKIAFCYGEELGSIHFLEFKDGEYEPCFEQSVRGARVFLIGSTFPPADNLMELLLMCDAAHRASAQNVTLVIPYFGWARQDRKNKSRAPIGAKLVTNLIEAAGATRVMTMDLHADQIQGFFEIPVDHLYASNIFVQYLKDLKWKNLTIASPDMGGAKRAKSYASYLGAGVAICYKERKKANEIEYMNLIGEVKNRDVILVDDIVDTGGTLVLAADLIKRQGAASVRAIVTHAILSAKAYEKITTSSLEELLVTDSIPLKQGCKSKIKVLSCAAFFADVMHLVHNKESISGKFII